MRGQEVSWKTFEKMWKKRRIFHNNYGASLYAWTILRRDNVFHRAFLWAKARCLFER